jgi:hypothetical protein
MPDGWIQPSAKGGNKLPQWAGTTNHWFRRPFLVTLPKDSMLFTVVVYGTAVGLQNLASSDQFWKTMS